METDPMNIQVLDAHREFSTGYKVDASRGERIGRVSSEWFSRPADERFLSLGELGRAVRGRADRSRTRVFETAQIHVEADRANAERLSLILPGADAPVLRRIGVHMGEKGQYPYRSISRSPMLFGSQV
jgi:hypothetical protein